MSWKKPAEGVYIRKSENVEVQVLGCTGHEWNDNVLCSRATDNGKRTWHVRLENFWKKYEETN